MSTPQIVEAIDVSKDSQFSLSTCVPCASPYEFFFDCLGERFNGRIVVAITFA
jgi:hypothetical protein|tara:strand:+ start:129 stop:287 length:159 start_codon:yes stop_codon:yes gene_type:complete